MNTTTIPQFQGLVHGPIDESRKLAERIDCLGTESSLEQCPTQLTNAYRDSCQLSSNIVAVSCVTDSSAVCPPGEIPWGSSCYSVYFNRSSFHDAQRRCKQVGGKLSFLALVANIVQQEFVRMI